VAERLQDCKKEAGHDRVIGIIDIWPMTVESPHDDDAVAEVVRLILPSDRVLKSRWTSLGVTLSRSSQCAAPNASRRDTLIEWNLPFTKSRMKRTSLVEVAVFCVIVFSLAVYFSFELALDGLVFVVIVLFFLYFVRTMRPKPGEQVDF